MSVTPSLQEFQDLARDATLVPVVREFAFDTDTAVSAYHKLARAPFGFLLESVVGGERWARYTILGTEPRAAWRLYGRRIETWTPDDGWVDQGESDDPLGAFDRMLQAHRPAEIPGLPRFWGGAVGYFGYDVVRLIERLPDAPPDDRGLPDAVFMLTGTVLVIDNLFNRARAVVAVQTDGVSRLELDRRYQSATREIDRLIQRLRDEKGPVPLEMADPGGEADDPFESTSTREAFENGVRRIQEYIRAGDAFQVVLSQRLGVPLSARPFDLYRALRTLNPSPYLFYLDLDGMRLVGSSPEVMVRLEEGKVTVRPIAGTRRRGKDAEDDRRLSESLLADPKERAEHLMLLDLGRNDVGRVARWGTVTVPQRMVIEKYSHVLHMVSTVEGRLREGMSAMDVFRASFPAGTVSGAVGYFGYGGQTMDTAIAIRTVVEVGGTAHVQAGAGIVADSVPADEYEETLSKARALLRAVRMVGG